MAHLPQELGHLADVDTTDVTDGHVVTRQADGTFALEAPSGAAAAGSNLVPLTTIDPATGEPVLMWDDDDQLVLTEYPS